MPKITLEIPVEKLDVFKAFLKTIPYVDIEEEDRPAQFKEPKAEPSEADYNVGDADELNNELNDFFGN